MQSTNIELAPSAQIPAEQTRHLPEIPQTQPPGQITHREQVLESQDPDPPKPHKEAPDTVPFRKLFRYATLKDKFLILLGTLGAACDGVSMPLFALFIGEVPNSFGPQNDSGQAIVDAASDISLKFLYVGIGSFVASYIGFAAWMTVGERQGIEIRRRYFKSLLQQEIAFYDSINPNELSTKISEECFNIQQGIGEKVSTFCYGVAMLIAGLIIGYIKGWQLALVLTGFLPVMGITGALFIVAMQKLTKINNEAYARAGAISEETLTSIRTVASLGGEEKETQRYGKVLQENKGPITKISIIAGCAIGFLFFAMYAIYALGFFIGAIFIDHDVYNPSSHGPYRSGDVLTVFFAIMMASFTPVRVTPSIRAFGIAKVNGAKAFKVIDRKSLISISDPRGLKPDSIQGFLQFKNISFAYPLKPDRKILDGLTFDIRTGEKTAFVGESGCGKTTCMQLIERFYDYEDGNGKIMLDGNELKTLNLKWMRENIGYVGQEPVLFATSIKENLLMAKEDSTDQEIWEALKKANAYDFVQSLPDQLNTFVGSSGAQLSGGQKQRLAIARAILKNPTILLLDEATSALDRRNEREIQKTLDEISQGRTTIVIAHRLSTVINSDHIIVFEGGKVVEEGNHEELVAKQGKYYALQHLQIQAEEIEKEKQQKRPPEEETDLDEIPVMPPILQATTLSAKKSSRKHSKLETEEVAIHVDDGRQTIVEETAAQSGKTSKAPHKPSKQTSHVISRLMAYNKSDIHLIILGILGASIYGMIQPCISIILSRILTVLSLPDAPDFRSKAGLYSGLFLMLAGVALVSGSLQMSCFNVVAERLSRKVRFEVFRKFIRMPIGWFDDPKNSPGALGSKLSSDATLINTLTSSVFGVYMQAVAAFAAGLLISLLASWKLGLIGLGVSPLVTVAGMIRAKFNQSLTKSSDDAYQESVAFASEAVNNMRTVASFAREDKLLENYSKKLDGPLKASMINAQKSGLAFGVGQFINFGVYALLFYVGALFIRDDGLSFQDMFQSIMAIMLACMAAGNALQFAPDVGAARSAAKSIFEILDTKPVIDIDDPNQTVRKPVTGKIEFKNIWFKYPSREKQIFKGLNLVINPSTKVALVGPSGCGKSTILALLQRFYDPDQGEVLVDGVNIKEYDLKYLRSCFGVVSQEPVLFNGTIEYNIKYSKENATDEQMRDAAIKANALKFIESNEFGKILVLRCLVIYLKM